MNAISLCDIFSCFTLIWVGLTVISRVPDLWPIPIYVEFDVTRGDDFHFELLKLSIGEPWWNSMLPTHGMQWDACRLQQSGGPDSIPSGMVGQDENISSLLATQKKSSS